MDRTARYTPLFARILISLIFIASGAGKIANLRGTEGYMASVHLPFVPLLLAATIAIEVMGGLSILAGFHARAAAAVLFLWLIPVTLIFHNFWAATGPAQQMQTVNFLKNLSIMGGLSMVVAFGAGAFSLDARRGTAAPPVTARPIPAA